jgi:spermidine synthase
MFYGVFFMLTGVLVHKTKDDWGNILVMDINHHRIMTFDSIYEQSRMDLTKPEMPIHAYIKAMLLVLAFVRPSHITLLGLGAGSLLRAIQHHCSCVFFQVVEIRQSVVDVANDFFGLPKTDNIVITVDDAKYYLENAEVNSSDIIFADMYQAYEMSHLQEQEMFLKQCHQLLSSKGWLVINYHEFPNVESAFFQLLKVIFLDVLVARVPDGNYIMFASKIAPLKPLNEYTENFIALERKFKINLEPICQRMFRLGEKSISGRQGEKFVERLTREKYQV